MICTFLRFNPGFSWHVALPQKRIAFFCLLIESSKCIMIFCQFSVVIDVFLLKIVVKMYAMNDFWNKLLLRAALRAQFIPKWLLISYF